jgi:hypothetical protein
VAEKPRLRSLEAVPDAAGPARWSALARAWSEPPRWLTLALAAALLLSGILLVYLRLQLGGRVETLERETGALRDALAAKDRTVDAQARRLDEVSLRLAQLRSLLQQPLEP